MKKLTTIIAGSLLVLVLGGCNSNDAVVTTTTIDASQLTTTTTRPGQTETTGSDSANETTVPAGEPIDSYDVISRQSTEQGETLYILVPTGDYTDVSIENFLGDLLENDPGVSSVEVFDDRAALDAALKPEADRTADELQAIADHHLVSLHDGSQVEFQGPMSDFGDFVMGS
ncbi:MAG: hypothetical protein WB239_10735 [Acidimicrobiia bacterium]